MKYTKLIIVFEVFTWVFFEVLMATPGYITWLLEFVLNVKVAALEKYPSIGENKIVFFGTLNKANKLFGLLGFLISFIWLQNFSSKIKQLPGLAVEEICEIDEGEDEGRTVCLGGDFFNERYRKIPNKSTVAKNTMKMTIFLKDKGSTLIIMEYGWGYCQSLGN